MAAAKTIAGIEGVLAYRGVNNPYIDARMRESRRRYGVNLFAPKGVRGRARGDGGAEGGARRSAC